MLLHQGALGDFVTAFPAMIRLRARFGALHAVCPGQHGRLARALGLIDGFHPVEAAVFAGLYGGEAAPRAAGILGGFRGILLLSFSRQLAESVRLQAGGDVYRCDPRPPPGVRTPVWRYLLDNLRAAGLIGGDGAERPAAGLPDHFPGLPEIPGEPSSVLLHPGAGSRRKRWPLDRFLTLARSLERAGLAPRFLLGPAEEDLAGALRGHRGACYPVLRAESLVDLAARLRSMLALVGNDSGVAHLAAFLGVPTVAVFGPSDPLRWEPAGPHVAVVRPGVGCDPCFEVLPRNCDGDNPRCLYETWPDDVERALRRLPVGPWAR